MEFGMVQSNPVQRSRELLTLEPWRHLPAWRVQRNPADVDTCLYCIMLTSSHRAVVDHAIPYDTTHIHMSYRVQKYICLSRPLGSVSQTQCYVDTLRILRPQYQRKTLARWCQHDTDRWKYPESAKLETNTWFGGHHVSLRAREVQAHEEIWRTFYAWASTPRYR